jgi:hypothetical protein
MNISRSNSLPSIALTRTDSTTLDGRSVEGEVQSSNLTLFGGTYAITPRSNGQLLSGESLAAFEQACKPFQEPEVMTGAKGETYAVYRAHWHPDNGAAAMMDVVVHLNEKGLPSNMHATPMDFHSDAHNQPKRSLFDIRIHDATRARL